MENVSLRDIFSYHQYQSLTFVLFLLEIPFLYSHRELVSSFISFIPMVKVKVIGT